MRVPRKERGKRKREETSSATHQEPASKRRNRSLGDPTSGVTLSKATSILCNKCERSYSNERSHRAVCTRMTVTCEYPALELGGPEERVTLHRVGKFFQCARCDKKLEKDQNMRDHARRCRKPNAHHDGGVSPSSFPGLPKTIAQRESSTSRSSHNSQRPVPSSPVNLESIHTLPTSPIRDVPPMLGPSTVCDSQGLAPSRPDFDSSDCDDHNVRVSSSFPSSSRTVGKDLPVTSGHFTAAPAEELCSPDATSTPTFDVSSPLSQSSQPNKYEALIRPGEDSIVSDALLLCTPYIVNTKHMALICTHCKHCVCPENALTHAHKFHPHCKIPKSFVAELNGKYPGLVTEKVHPSDVMEPIFGLAVPMEYYVVCSRCRRGYANSRSWRNHVCDNPDVDLNGQPPYFSSLVQTFFRGPRLCYFAIKTPTLETSRVATDDYELFKSQRQDVDASEDEIEEAEDYRELNQFLWKEGWITHVSGCLKSELSVLTSSPKRGEHLAPIAHGVFVLMSNIQSVIGMGNFHLRRLLGRRPSDNHDGVRTVHHRDVQPESIKRYSLTVSCLIYFVMRCHQGWESNYTMKLTEAQERACQALNDACRVNGGDEGDLAGNEEDLYGYLECGNDPLEDPDDDVYEDPELVPDGNNVLDESERLLRSPITENIIQDRILELLISLYTHLPTGNDNKFYSPILRFIVLFSLKKSGQWLPPRQITHVIAALLFCGREVMMAMMYNQLLKDPKLRYSEAYGKIASFLDGDLEGPIPSMYILMRPLNRFFSAEEGSLRFTALDFSGDNIIVAGHVLYLRDIRYFVETLIDEIKEHIRLQLFFGLDIADINWSPGVVHEEPRNVSIRHSCFRDARNIFPKHKDDLLRAVLTHPLLSGHFHYVGEQGQIIWKAGSCFAYMNSCHEAEMMLFSGTQTSVGEPGRGTEVSSHLINNVSGGTIRNVFVMFQYFCMMGTFNKTSHVTERDMAMIRVPHPEIGRLWMLYLTFVRPLLVVWQKYFHGQKAAARARDNLFFGLHRRLTFRKLCPVTPIDS